MIHEWSDHRGKVMRGRHSGHGSWSFMRDTLFTANKNLIHLPGIHETLLTSDHQVGSTVTTMGGKVIQVQE